MQIFPFFHDLAILLFSEIVIFMIIGNKTSCRPIQSVIILVINKSDSRCEVVRFCYHSYDYRPNWTPPSPITITYYINNCETPGFLVYKKIISSSHAVKIYRLLHVESLISFLFTSFNTISQHNLLRSLNLGFGDVSSIRMLTSE